ncbi:MAG: HIT domain-containing protein [Myxococcota bacterium]
MPKRHFGSWFEATGDEQRELIAAIEIARSAIVRDRRPDGLNIGVNVGVAAGQTVPHLHVHVIPRYAGTRSGRGGVRGVIPRMQNYLQNSPDGSSVARDREALPSAAELRALIRGGEDDPLLPHLKSHLDAARVARLAVAFVLPSGVDLLEEHLRGSSAPEEVDSNSWPEITRASPTRKHSERLLDLHGQYEDRIELRSTRPSIALSIRRPTSSKELPRAVSPSSAAQISPEQRSAKASSGITASCRVATRLGLQRWSAPLRSCRGPSTIALDQTWIDAYRERRPGGQGDGAGDRVGGNRVARTAAGAARRPERGPSCA